jgi:hypothetical protein
MEQANDGAPFGVVTVGLQAAGAILDHIPILEHESLITTNAPACLYDLSGVFCVNRPCHVLSLHAGKRWCKKKAPGFPGAVSSSADLLGQRTPPASRTLERGHLPALMGDYLTVRPDVP